LQPTSVWCFRYFPSQDGPAHLENAVILRDYNREDRPLLRTFYEINTNPEPNWASTLLLAGLMYVLPPLAAEKVLLTGYLLLLPLSVRFALNAVRPGAGVLAVLAFPFVPNLFFHMGFYNYCYSLPLFFLVAGWWLKHRERMGWRGTLVLMALGLVLYFCHLMSLVAAWVLIGACLLWRLLLEGRRNGVALRGLWGAVGGTLPGTAAAFLPSLL